MRYRAVTTIVLVVLSALACGTTKPATLQVNTDYDKSVPWTEMKSFRMASGRSGESSYRRYPRLEEMVHESLVAQLVERGFERTEDGPTDFRVAFELIFRGDKTRAPGTTPRGIDGQPTGLAETSQTSVLIVRMLDPTTSQVLWQGRVSEFKVGAANREADLRKAVWRILVEFPPITG